MDNFSTYPPSEISRLTLEKLLELVIEMEFVFSHAELNAYDEDSYEITLASKLCHSTFWEFAPGEKSHPKYTEAVTFYLAEHWRSAEFPKFEDYFTELACSFHKYRMHKAYVRDRLVSFLHKNLDHLKRLYMLHDPGNLDAPSTEEGIQKCFSTFDWALPREISLSQWILEKWLPFHFKYFYQQAEAKRRDEDERRSKGARRNNSPELNDDMSP